MTKGFFRERKHYSLQEITDNLININMEETRRIVGILKKYGVVKAVKKNRPDFDDLSNEDIVLTDVIDSSSDIEYIFDYVGVVVIEGQVFKCYPKYIKSTEHLFENLKQVLKVIKKYNASEQLIYLFNGEDDSKIFNRLAVSIHLLETYYADGLYTNQKEIIETNGEGEILWDKTINETFAIIQNNKPYYVELQTKNTIDNDYDYFRRLHECVLTQCSRELSDAGLLELFELTEVELTQEEMSDFGDASYILYRLQSEIQTQYITRKQNLLKTIYTYIANEKTDKNDVSYSLYGRILNVLATTGLKASSIAHEMKNDRNAIYDNYNNIVDALKEYGMWDELNSSEKTRKSYKNVPYLLESNDVVGKKLVTFMDTMLEEIEKKQFEIRYQSIADILTVIKKVWERDYAWLSIEIIMDEDIVYQISEDILQVIFDNLILNSVQQNENTQKLMITISINETNGFLNIKYCDNGKGLNDKYKTDPMKILEVHETTRTNGHGLGMWIVNNTCTMSGGEIQKICGEKGFEIEFTIGGKI